MTKQDFNGHTKGKYSITVGNQPFGAHPTNRITYFRIVKDGDDVLTHETVISDESWANADLFAAAPDLLAENVRLREGLAKLKDKADYLSSSEREYVLDVCRKALQETPDDRT